MNKDEQTTLLRKSFQTNPCYNCKEIAMGNPKLDQRCTVCGTSPAQRILDQRAAKRQAAKPMNKQGKGGRRTNTQNAKNKKRFIQEGITRCQLCGSDQALSNSHSRSEDRRLESAKTALLCIWPCHQFLELHCTHEEREAVNEFLIETNLEGHAKFIEVCRLLPAAKAWKLEEALGKR
jgi:hypothetical protein